MARTELLAVILAIVWAAPLTGRAQPAPDDPTTRAAEAFQRAQAAAAEEDFVSALEAFREAQSLAPHDAVRFNIGLCLERLGRYSEALAEFEHAAASSQLAAEQREDAGTRAERARTRLGRLRVTDPAGARVSVDGVERCDAPCDIDLDPGRHQVSAEGSTEARSLVIRAGDQVDLSLMAARQAPPPPPPSPRPRAGLRVGVLGWVGAGVAVVGAVSTTVFGLRVLSLKDDYLADPTQERLDDGRLAVTLTNVSLVAAVLGAALFVVDVLLLESAQPDAATTAQANAGFGPWVW